MYTVDSLFQEAHPWILEFHFYFWDTCKLNENMTKIRPSRFVFSRFDAKRLNRGIGYLRTVRNLPYFRGIYVGIQRHDLCKKRVKWVMCVLNRLNEMSSTQMVGARIFLNNVLLGVMNHELRYYYISRCYIRNITKTTLFCIIYK